MVKNSTRKKIIASTAAKALVVSDIAKVSYVPLMALVLVVVSGIVFFLGQDTPELSLALAGTSSASIRDSSESKLKSDQRPLKRKQGLKQHPQFKESWDIFQRIEAEQTGRVVPPRSLETSPPQRPVHFMQFHTGVSQLEAYSGSWLQKKNDFMSMKLDAMKEWEDAAIFAYHDAPNNNRASMLHMPLDMLDFSLEHFSSYWDLLKIYENDIPFKSSVSKLEEYIRQAPKYKLVEEPIWRQTIAVIAFHQYTGEQSNQKIAVPEKSDKLNTVSLAAALESVRRAGFGRAVVVGVTDKDEKLADASFRLLSPSSPNKLSTMELAFVKGDPGVNYDNNIPKVALLGLRRAFELIGQRSEEQRAYVEKWLGNSQEPDYWEYVYLSEHDSILYHRPRALERIKALVDGGNLMLPHRLQPIPHESDVSGALRRETYLPMKGDFEAVTAISIEKDTCCDENWGPDRSPGKEPNFPQCDGKMWYECDFGKTRAAHERIKVYKLIRLEEGTGTTLIAGTEQGRRCIPQKNGPGCKEREEPLR